jgi:hypothetical protein
MRSSFMKEDRRSDATGLPRRSNPIESGLAMEEREKDGGAGNSS